MTPSTSSGRSFATTAVFCDTSVGIKKIFSRELFNPKSVNSLRFNGLVNKSGVDIQPKKDGKGVQVTTKIKNSALHPALSTTRVFLDKNDRRTLKSVKKSVKELQASSCQALPPSHIADSPLSEDPYEEAPV
uniref:Large ribosomal subunit protein eL28 n=1 Tax=Ditylenchus dipsaci TaxID=166011 RepID=A0A915EAC3_9BILA